MAKPIIIPPQAALLERGLLLDQIPEFDMPGPVADRWVAEGVSWQPRICGRDMETFRVAASACEDDFFEDDPIRECVAYVEQSAFTVKDRLAGSNLDLERDELERLMAARFAEMTSYVFADTLVSRVPGVKTLPSEATAPDGIAFGSAATPLYNALANIEAELGDRQYGQSGLIFLTPGLLANAINTYGVEWRDGAYRTPIGNRVISDPGFHDADAPTGRTASGAGEEWVYAAGQVSYRSSVPKFFQARMGRPGSTDRNQIVGFVDSFGILVFDPCPVTAVLVTYTQS